MARLQTKFAKRLSFLCLLLIIPAVNSFGMHIAEGFLPPSWSIGWWVVFLPFFILGLIAVSKKIKDEPTQRILLAVVTAFTFVLSALKLPSLTGSCSHLTGIAFGAIIFGLPTMAVAGFVVLLFQALLLAHGGITTLGANAFSMAIIGSAIAITVYKGLKMAKAPQWLSLFLAATLSDLGTYACTAGQLSLAFNSPGESFWSTFIKFGTVLGYTQLPLAIIEGIATVLIFNTFYKYSTSELGILKKI